MILTIVQQATVVAALISLLGVVTVGILAHARESRKYRAERRASYRTEARTTVKNVVVSASDFERQGRVMSDMWRWLSLGFAAGSKLANSTEDTMSRLASELELASLTLAEPELRALVLELEMSFHECAAQVHAAADEFAGLATNGFNDSQREASWDGFSSARANLVSVARDLLRSPVQAK